MDAEIFRFTENKNRGLSRTEKKSFRRALVRKGFISLVQIKGAIRKIQTT